MDQALLSRVAERPAQALKFLKKKRAEESLLAFVRLTWKVIEPKRRFIEGWALHAIIDHLEAVSRGDIKKVLISCPPGMSKSLLTCVFWPAFEWGPRNRPDLRYICASYSDKLSRRDSRRCRRLIQSDIYQEFWGDRFKLEADSNAVERFGNDHTGWRLATSVRGLGTGERGDRFVIDDALSVKDAESDAVRGETRRWFSEVTSTRINDPEDRQPIDDDEEPELASAFLAIGQRVHVADISGMILKDMPGWVHLCMPMEYERNHPTPSTSPRFKDPRTKEGELLFPERFSRKYVEEELKPSLSAEGGSYACNPAEAPVLMADLTVKPVGNIVPGDKIIGFTRTKKKPKARDSRHSLVLSEVLEVFRRKAPVVSITLDSGEIVRCTPDHHWFRRTTGEGKSRYGPAKIGTLLSRVCPAYLPALTPEEQRMGGWLGGFFDGEGSVSCCEKRKQPGFRPSVAISFYQGSGRNLPICECLEGALDHFGFFYTIDQRKRKEGHEPARQYRLLASPALATIQKFLHIAEPTKWRDRLLQGALGAKFRTGKERVVSIKPESEEEVFSLRTTTGNYVVWGLMSSNCASQLQQRPIPREGGDFKREWIKFLDLAPSRVTLRVRGWDLAATKDGRGARTAGVKMSLTEDGKFVVEDVDKGRWSAGEAQDKIAWHADRDRCTVYLPQDPGQAGVAQVEAFAKLLAGHDVRFSPETGSKTDRARPLTAQAEAGNFYLVRAPWNDDYIRELTEFPGGDLSDQVDASSRASLWLFKSKPKRAPSSGGWVIE